MRNSDHYNFARHGIPAFRLVAGFDDPASTLRYVLTPNDRAETVNAEELECAARLTAAIAVRACSAAALDLRPGGMPG
jgi:Zn-dependent M28 family amino/carboxypeptidase